MDTTHTNSTADKLHALQACLGPDRLRTSEHELQHYARSTSLAEIRPIAVALPTSTEQVQQLVRLASRLNLALYPISRGCNWGYGDACPSTDNQVIVDLSHMNQILEVNEELAYTVIQPGVSQGQLHQYLHDHNIPLWPDVTGAGLNASLVGNTLDRGFGHTRHGDHFLTACAMEVVLPDGRILNTGFGHFPNAQAQHVYRYGVGPFIDGLFAQSNFGIVTRLTLWLMPEPEDFSAFFFFAKNDHDLQDIVDRLAPLRRRGLLHNALHIGNDLRVFSARTRYPWQRANNKTPLPHDLRLQLRREHGVGAWNGGGAIYGTRATVRATQQAIRRALRGYPVRFINDRKLALANHARKFLSFFGAGQRLGELLDVLQPVYGLLKGIPSDEHLRGAAWRVRDDSPPAAEDPRDTHAGLIWVSPVLPNRGQDARAVTDLMTPIYTRHGFEPLLTFTMVNERAMICISNIAFDRRDTDEAARAKACYNELTEALINAGYIPYRTGHAGYPKLHQHPSTYWDLLSYLKHTLDPHNTISPGRYLPNTTPQQAPPTPTKAQIT